MHDIDLASQYQIPFSSFGLVSLAFWGSLCITECIQGQVEGSFCLSGYKQMQNSEFHYRLQWFISFFAYFSHLIWNIGSDIVFFCWHTQTYSSTPQSNKLQKKKSITMYMNKKWWKCSKRQSNNERCIRLALFKSAQDDKDRIGSQTRI